MSTYAEMFDPAKFADSFKAMMPDMSAVSTQMEKANQAFIAGTTALMDQSVKLAEQSVKDSTKLMTFEKDPKVYGETVTEMTKKFAETAPAEMKTSFDTVSKMTGDMVSAFGAAAAEGNKAAASAVKAK